MSSTRSVSDEGTQKKKARLKASRPRQSIAPRSIERKEDGARLLHQAEQQARLMIKALEENVRAALGSMRDFSQNRPILTAFSDRLLLAEHDHRLLETLIASV